MSLDRIDAGDPATLADSLATRFTDLHGRAPDGVFAAPGRVNLIGEHTDYNGGLCLPIALPHATYAAVARREDGTVTVASVQEEGSPFQGRLDELGPGRVKGWVSYAAGVLWALQEDGIDLPALDIVVDSRVPVGSGLSSSAALECSVALAACAAAGVDVDDALRHRLVRACMRAETEVAGAPTGGMDQTISLLATADAALLIDFDDDSSRSVPLGLADAGLTLLVTDTRVQHALVDGGYGARRADCEAAAAALGVPSLREATLESVAGISDERVRRRATHIVTEIARVSETVTALGAA